MVVIAFALASLCAVGFAVQTARSRRLQPRGEWVIGGVLLPDPDDSSWKPAFIGTASGFALVDIQVGRDDYHQLGWITVNGMSITGNTAEEKKAYRYARAVTAAYANRKTLEAMLS